jgi:hypothetical protein
MRQLRLISHHQRYRIGNQRENMNFALILSDIPSWIWIIAAICVAVIAMLWVVLED